MITQKQYTITITEAEAEFIAEALTDQARAKYCELEKLREKNDDGEIIQARTDALRELRKLRNEFGALIGIIYLGGADTL